MKRTRPIIMTLFSVAIAALMIVSSGVALADDTTSTGTGTVESTLPVNGTIEGLTISVTHPASISYTINPNLGVGNEFVAPDISITNNSLAAIKVTVKSLTSASGGTLQFTDVAHDAQDWANLNLANSKTYIALGVLISDNTGWNIGYDANTHYAINITDQLFGVLKSETTGKLSLAANHGLAFDQAYNANHDLVLVFNFE